LGSAENPRNQETLQSSQRIACTLARDHIGSLVSLRVLSGMSGKARYSEAQQHGSTLLAHQFDCPARQLRRFVRIRAIALENRQTIEGPQVGANISARCLVSGGD